MVKNLSANAGTKGDALISGWGRFPGGRNGTPVQYFCQDNLMDRGVWLATVLRVRRS